MENSFFEEQKISYKFVFFLSLIKHLQIVLFFEFIFLIITLTYNKSNFSYFWIATLFFILWVLLVMLYQVWKYKTRVFNLFIKINENLHYGFDQKDGVFSQTIDFDDIKTIRFIKRNHFQIHFSKRTLYSAKTGYFVEIDWKENKIGGFSIINHKDFFEAIKDKIPADRIEYNP